MPGPAFTELTTALCIFCILLVPLAGIGISVVNTGLSRSHSAAHALLSSLCVFSVAVGVYFICGFAWQGHFAIAAHTISVAGKPWSILAAGPFFLRHLDFDGSPSSLAAWLGMLGAGLTATIPLGSGAERWRLSASCASTALLAGCTYPLFAHWVWGGGWLAQLGANYGLGHGFVDAGGTSTIQVVGGVTALAIAWILGPRRGKYSASGMPAAIPGHNAVLILLGCSLAYVGWLGLNSAGAILFAGASPGRTVLVAMNTTLAAASAGLAAAVVTRLRFGRPDVSITANGWVGGLVASSAGCAFVAPAEVVVIGLVAGALVAFSVDWLESRFGVDDPGGAISVHGVAGFWGLLAFGIFARFPGPVHNIAGEAWLSSGDTGQWLAQLTGIATLLGFVLPLSYALNALLNALWPYRLPPEGERQGLDLYELGAGAYPEFVTHAEEFTQH